MAAHAAPLLAVRTALGALMTSRREDEALAARLGLSADAARALHWWRLPLVGGQGPRRLTLAFGDDCPGRQLPRALRSPLTGETMPVDAVRGGRFGHAQTAWVRAENASNRFLEGTLTAVLRRTARPSSLLALTSGHVLAAARPSARGDDVTLWLDGEPDAPPINGRLFDWQPNFQALPVTCAVDAALVEVSAAALRPLAGRGAEWPVGTASALADDQLFIRTRGRAIGGQAPHLFGASLCIAGDESRPYLLDGALCWTPDEATLGGDSGAPIWNSRDELVGLHAGVAPDGVGLRCAIAVPIAPVLAWAGAELVRRDEPLVRAGPLATPAAPVPAPMAGPGPASLPAGGTAVPAAAGPAGQDVVILARTVWGEARGERGQIDGMEAVAHVVLNRVRRATYWGRDVVEVCRKPWQFSCWNRNDPNLPQLLAVDATNARFAQALAIARRLMAQEQDRPQERLRGDPTAGATHYHAARLAPPPRWAAGHRPCARIGAHLFFNDIP